GALLKYEWDEEQGYNELKRDIELVKKYHGTADNRIQVILGAGSPDICTSDLLQEIRKNATQLGVGIQIVIEGTPYEFREIVRRHGKTPIEYLNDLNYLGPDTLLVHCRVTSEHPLVIYPGGGKDHQIIADSGASIVDTALTYLRHGRYMYSHARCQNAGINMSIGTTVWPQDILEEIRAALYASKIVEGITHATTAMDGYNAATLGGARALGRTDIGRITPGAKADLVIFNLQTRRMRPIRDPIKNIVYSATSEDIETVIIGGKSVVRNGQVRQLDEIKLSEKIQKVTEKLWDSMPHGDFAGRTVDELSPLSLPHWDS
ncbi:MAG: amidohydrolase family protein, partial [Candidatus Kariarchaeaceae archaeon]